MAYRGFLGKVTSQRRWTPSSIDCYNRGCSCAGCIYDNLFESGKCQCKAAVLELVRVIGKPEEYKREYLGTWDIK